MTRAFVAARPPADVLDAVAELVESMDIGTGRVMTPAQWHVTLQFLGNHADVDGVEVGLQGLTVMAASAQLGGIGAFPNARRARVLWLGLAMGSELFHALAREVGQRLAPLGYEQPERPYHAHLTLARFKTPRDVLETVAAGPRKVGPAWIVEHVTVYESRLLRTGAEYMPRCASSALSRA